jgi:DNA repair photolyase
MDWIKKLIKSDDGSEIEAVAPMIISASRSTDIPAFYAEWLFNRIARGYIAWTNPFNQKTVYVSFDEMRFIVFWSKNPKPLIPYLEYLDNKKIGYYFQITLNDYEYEKLEPNVPPISERVETFILLSNKIGKQRTIWRFDPLLLSDDLSVDALIQKIENIGNQIYQYTEKLVFSFADINVYRKVVSNLRKSDKNYREFTENEISDFIKKLTSLSLKWDIELATCAENINLDDYKISKNRCIDDKLISQISKDDKRLMQWLGITENPNSLFGSDYTSNPKLKDRGQRQNCGCIISKDIGMYNTCNHLCIYCYANNSSELVQNNILKHDKYSPSLI